MNKKIIFFKQKMDTNDNSSICQLDSSIDLDDKLLMFASSSVYNSKFVLRLLTSELENEESGFWTTLMKLEDKDEDKLNRPERRMPTDGYCEVNFPSDRFAEVGSPDPSNMGVDSFQEVVH
jgi:hypothetical protein